MGEDVAIRLKLQDQARVSKGLRATGDDAQRLGRKVRGAGDDGVQMSRGMDRGRKSLGGMSHALLGVGVSAALGLGAVTASSVKAAATFEQTISGLGAVTGAQGSALDALRSQALKSGADTAYSAQEAAVAQTELAKGGISTANILSGGLNAALGLAAAGELELGTAAEIAANAMNLFGLKGNQSGHVADALATAANVTTASVGDMGAALAQGGSVAKSAGYSFDETVVALEALANSGIKGSDAGTSLKSSIIQLIKPTKEQASLAKSLGLSFLDAHGNMKKLGAVSSMLREKLGGQTKAQRTATLATLAGTDGVRALTALYDAGPKSLAGYQQGLAKQGTAADVAARKQDNLKGKMEQLSGSVDTLKILVGTALIPILTSAAVKATSLVNAMAGWGPVLVPLSAVIGTAVIGITALAAATWAWDAALAANPVGLVIVGLVALGAGLVVAYNRFATFRNGVNGVWSWIRGNWPLLASIIAPPFAPLIFIARHFGQVKGAAQGAWNTIRDGATGVAGAIDGVVSKIGGLKDAITSLPGGALGKVGDLAGGALDFVGARASGGPINQTGSYLVGERGPEIVQLNRGSNVVPNHQIGRPRLGSVAAPRLAASGGGGGATGLSESTAQMLISLLRDPPPAQVFLDGRPMERSVRSARDRRNART